MISARNPALRRKIALATAALVAVICADYVFGINSEAFKYAQDVVTNSDALRRKIGSVKSVRLHPFFAFNYRTGFGNSSSSLNLRIDGTERSVDLNLDLRQVDGNWKVVHSSFPL